MATNKPRITVTLDEHTYDVVKSIAEMGKGSMSAFIADLLDSAMPTLERMAATFQAIKKAQTTERDKFLASMDRAQALVEPSIMEAVGQFDLFLATAEAAAGVTASSDLSRAVAPAADPRPVTRGSTPLIRKKSAASTNATKPRAGKASGRKS